MSKHSRFLSIDSWDSVGVQDAFKAGISGGRMSDSTPKLDRLLGGSGGFPA